MSSRHGQITIIRVPGEIQTTETTSTVYRMCNRQKWKEYKLIYITDFT